MGYALDFVAVSCEFELFCCMIGASDQRAGFNMTEAHLLSLILQVFEFIGMVETFYWQEPFAGTQILPNSKYVTINFSQVFHHVYYLIKFFTHTKDKARLCR